MIGSSVGNYQIVSHIGMGGMGEVYLARHAMLGRPAAVKVLLPEMSSNREVVDRFFNEARAATSIRSPSIVEVYDFGYLPAGSAYLIMEFLEGESLASRIMREERLRWSAVLVLARQIAGALQAAHEKGIVHRDLKPENVFVVKDLEVQGGERIKLLDFGIAKVAASTGEGTKTRTGAAIGTPTFMAPEQCRDAGRVDARADLYALGCLMYVLLCGRPPFVADGPGDVMAHHLYFQPDPLRKHESSLPEGVERLVLWLLQKDPEARPQSAAAVISAIDALVSGVDVDKIIPSFSVLQPEVASPPRSSRPMPLLPEESTMLLGSGTPPRVVRAVEETVLVRGRAARPRSRGWAVLGGAALVLVGGGVVIFRSLPAAETSTTSLAAAPSPPVLPPAPGNPPLDAAPVPDPPRMVMLQFVVTPKSAKYQVRVDGKQFDSALVDVTMSRTQPVRVEVSAPGYHTYTATPMPVSDLMFSVQLQPLKAASRSPSPVKEPPPAPTVAPEPEPAPRVKVVNEL